MHGPISGCLSKALASCCQLQVGTVTMSLRPCSKIVLIACQTLCGRVGIEYTDLCVHDEMLSWPIRFADCYVTSDTRRWLARRISSDALRLRSGTLALNAEQERAVQAKQCEFLRFVLLSPHSYIASSNDHFSL